MALTHKIAELVPISRNEPDGCVGCPTRRSKLVWESDADGYCEFCKKPYCDKCFEVHRVCCEKAPRIEKKRKVKA